MKLDLVAGLDVLKLLHLELGQVLQGVLLVLLDYGGDLGTEILSMSVMSVTITGIIDVSGRSDVSDIRNICGVTCIDDVSGVSVVSVMSVLSVVSLPEGG